MGHQLKKKDRDGCGKEPSTKWRDPAGPYKHLTLGEGLGCALLSVALLWGVILGLAWLIFA